MRTGYFLFERKKSEAAVCAGFMHWQRGYRHYAAMRMSVCICNGFGFERRSVEIGRGKRSFVRFPYSLCAGRSLEAAFRATFRSDFVQSALYSYRGVPNASGRSATGTTDGAGWRKGRARFLSEDRCRRMLAMEVGDGQAKDVSELLRREEHYQKIQIHCDLYGKERIVSARSSEP